MAVRLQSLLGSDRVVIHTGKEPVAEQLAMFARARIVVGAHGAGLANTLACRPKTAIVLLPMYPMTDMTFFHNAVALDHQIFLVQSVVSYYYGSYGTVEAHQLADIVNATQQALEWTASRWRPDDQQDAPQHREL